jgi:spore coat protein JC
MAHLKACYFHLVRFGEGLRLAKEKMDQKNLYFVNPSFDQ